MKRPAILLFMVVLTACAVPAPQMTFTPEATLTLRPLPTETPIPTETATPTATATESMSETAISTQIEGNPFSGVGIELKMLNSEITLSTEGDDLTQMADILDQLAKEGKITVKPVTDQRGAMQLGPSADKVPDLVINTENNAFVDKYGYQPMMLVQDYDLSTYRWQDVTTRPVLVGFNNADGGGDICDDDGGREWRPENCWVVVGFSWVGRIKWRGRENGGKLCKLQGFLEKKNCYTN